MDQPVLDRSIIEQTSKGNPELRQRLLASYVTMLERARPKIEAGLEQLNREAVDFAAHSIRSSSKTVGAMPLARLLGTLEDEAQTLSEEELRRVGTDCLQMIELVKQAIEQLEAPS